jgi:hypothetical protein
MTLSECPLLTLALDAQHAVLQRDVVQAALAQQVAERPRPADQREHEHEVADRSAPRIDREAHTDHHDEGRGGDGSATRRLVGRHREDRQKHRHEAVGRLEHVAVD